MNPEMIKKIESKLNEINLEITKVKKRAKLKIKDLENSKSKLLQKLNADNLKMMDGIPGDKIIEAIKKLKSFKDGFFELLKKASNLIILICANLIKPRFFAIIIL